MGINPPLLTNMFYTYTQKSLNKELFEPVVNTLINKPGKGLWACEDNAWKIWCDIEDYSCGNICTQFKLIPNSKIYVINDVQDFLYLMQVYPYEPFEGLGRSIDWVTLSRQFDGVQLTQKGLYKCRSLLTEDTGNVCYNTTLLMGTCSWDVPSICIFNYDIITDVREVNPQGVGLAC